MYLPCLKRLSTCRVTLSLFVRRHSPIITIFYDSQVLPLLPLFLGLSPWHLKISSPSGSKSSLGEYSSSLQSGIISILCLADLPLKDHGARRSPASTGSKRKTQLWEPPVSQQVHLVVGKEPSSPDTWLDAQSAQPPLLAEDSSSLWDLGQIPPPLWALFPLTEKEGMGLTGRSKGPCRL